MKRVLLVFVLFLVPYVSQAKTFILPSGLLYEAPDPVKIVKKFILPSGLSFWAVHYAEAAELTLEEQIRFWIISMAQQYGADPDLLLRIEHCESKLNPNARGDFRSETK